MSEPYPNGTGVINLAVTGVADTFPAYTADEIASGRAASSVRLRLHYLTRFAAVLPDVPLTDVTRAHVVRFLSWGQWRPNTRRSAATAVRSWLRWAHRAGITTVPAPDTVDLPATPRGMPRPVDDAVILAAAATAAPPVVLAILLGREAGLRRAEIACVHGRDVSGGSLIVHGKGGKERTVPLSDALTALLAAREPGPVFPGAYPCRPGCGPHLSPDAVGRRISRAFHGEVTAHQLRHTFATRVYQAGHDVIALQDLLGHASVATTMVYAAAADDAKCTAVAAAQLGEVAVRRFDGHTGVGGQ